MVRVMTLLSSHASTNGPFFNYKGGEEKGGGTGLCLMARQKMIYSMYANGRYI